MSEKIEYLISKLAESYIDEALSRQCGQIMFAADDMEISIEDLNILLDWFGINEDDYLI